MGRLLHLRIGGESEGPKEGDVEAGRAVAEGNGEQARLLAEETDEDSDDESDEERSGIPRPKKFATEPRVVRTANKRRATLAKAQSVPTTSKGARGEGGVNRLSGEGVGAREASEMGRKHRPRVAGQGENLPLDALRFLSDWTAVLEERGTVPGAFFVRLFLLA